MAVIFSFHIIQYCCFDILLFHNSILDGVFSSEIKSQNCLSHFVQTSLVVLQKMPSHFDFSKNEF